MRGRVSRRDDGLNLHAVGVPPDVGSFDAAGPLVLVLAEQRATERVMNELAEMLRRHSGETEVILRVHRAVDREGVRGADAGQGLRRLFGDLKSLLGPRASAES